MPRVSVHEPFRAAGEVNPRFVGSYKKGTHPPFRLFLTIHGDGIALDRRMRIQPQVAPTIPADKDVQHLEEQCCRRSDGLRQCLTSVPSGRWKRPLLNRPKWQQPAAASLDFGRLLDAGEFNSHGMAGTSGNPTNPTMAAPLIRQYHHFVGFPPNLSTGPTRSLALRWSTCIGRPSNVRRTCTIPRPTSMLARRPHWRKRWRRVCSLTEIRSAPALSWAI